MPLLFCGLEKKGLSYMVMARIVYYNGDFLPTDKVAISPFNRGLLYGDGVFETLRAYNGRVFRLEQHLIRMHEGLQVLRIEPNREAHGIERSINELMKLNKLSDAALRISVFRGDGEGPEPPDGLQSSILISAKPFNTYRAEDYATGFWTYLVSMRRSRYSPLSRIKSLNYLDNILARLEAREHNAQEALLLNTLGWVAEGATSNIFIIKDKKLITPPVDAGILPGITRAAVLEIADSLNLQAREETFSPEELLRADEAFLTNSLMEIMPLVMLNEKKIGKGKPGSLTALLHRCYRELVNRELQLPA
jgi:branched-chain amino acid aminotransferase